MLVPQNIGRSQLNVRSFFRNVQAVQKQKSIVDSLQASLVSVMSNKTDNTSKDDTEDVIFNVTLELITDSKIISNLKKKYSNTKNNCHTSCNLKVKTVYGVTIDNEKKAFEDKGKSIGNVMELWHGTRASNILSILKAGLVIPPSSSSHCTGRMFGNGLYFSDQSTKSLNYSHGYWGGSRENNCFMFLADVAMGNHYVPANYGGQYPVSGYDSTFAKANKSGVTNNEMIVYKLFQANLKYLVEFDV
jgi:poly [ADP-ribose] polymerase